MTVEDDLRRLADRIRGYGSPRAVVAFSGGVDSSVVVAVAARALGPRAVTAATAVSPSYPTGELDQAREVAASLSVRHEAIRTHEVEREAYARNDERRCFHCKAELYATLRTVLHRPDSADAVILSGANADDASDFRPGLEAGVRQSIRSPLLEEGIGKGAVRAVAALLGLSVADKPSLACLSSRVAFGIRISPELLGRIDRAEQAVRSLGFDPVRVRHRGDHATIEVGPLDVGRLAAHPGFDAVCSRLRRMGWASVAIDPRGYRAGSLNPPTTVDRISAR